jgi:hypothetical protein
MAGETLTLLMVGDQLVASILGHPEHTLWQ